MTHILSPRRRVASILILIMFLIVASLPSGLIDFFGMIDCRLLEFHKSHLFSSFLHQILMNGP